MNLLRQDFRKLLSSDRQTDGHGRNYIPRFAGGQQVEFTDHEYFCRFFLNSAVNNSASPGRSALCHQHCLSSLAISHNLSLGANCRTLDGKQLTRPAQ